MRRAVGPDFPHVEDIRVQCITARFDKRRRRRDDGATGTGQHIVKCDRGQADVSGVRHRDRIDNIIANRSGTRRLCGDRFGCQKVRRWQRDRDAFLCDSRRIHPVGANARQGRRIGQRRVCVHIGLRDRIGRGQRHALQRDQTCNRATIGQRQCRCTASGGVLVTNADICQRRVASVRDLVAIGDDLTCHDQGIIIGQLGQGHSADTVGGDSLRILRGERRQRVERVCNRHIRDIGDEAGVHVGLRRQICAAAFDRIARQKAGGRKSVTDQIRRGDFVIGQLRQVRQRDIAFVCNHITIG